MLIQLGAPYSVSLPYADRSSEILIVQISADSATAGNVVRGGSGPPRDRNVTRGSYMFTFNYITIFSRFVHIVGTIL
jgi:hypothetical protein